VKFPCLLQATVYCVNDCHNRGTCELGFCVCAPPFYGVDCSLSISATPSISVAPETTAVPRGWEPQGDIQIPQGSFIRSRVRTGALIPAGGNGAGGVIPGGGTRVGDKIPAGGTGSGGAIPAGGCADPCVYVYELPARFNVLALKAEVTTPTR